MIFDTTEYLDDLGDPTTRRHQRKGKHVKRQPKQSDAPPGRVAMFDPVAQLGVETRFNPTFSSSRFEREWILTYLGPFYEDHIISDVLHPLKGGKEATVYCCKAYPTMGVDLIAAKVYRPKIFRTMKNDALYRQGHAVLDEQGKEVRSRREMLAMRKKTRFGQDLSRNAWLANEYQTLLRLDAAGADVPKPIAQSSNVILMEYVGNAKMSAPTLSTVTLSPRAAQRLFDRLLLNVELMLAHGCIHADLSPFNVLYWNGEIKIIDFPQAVDPYKNPAAFTLLSRDVARLCQYFARFGVPVDAALMARDLWARYVMHDR